MVVCIDVEPDARTFPPGEPPSWRGFELLAERIDAIRERHAKLFADFPQNKAVRINRVEVGQVVIDHEDVFRSPDATPFQVAAIYTIAGGKIARVDFAR